MKVDHGAFLLWMKSGIAKWMRLHEMLPERAAESMAPAQGANHDARK
jgi:hypothetical protein